MQTRTNYLSLLLSPAAWVMVMALQTAPATNANAKSIELYTPYTKISVPPGESIDYTVDVINNSNSIRDVEILLSGLPDGWNYTLKSGGWNIRQVSVLPGEKKTLSLTVEVPLKIDKGSYKFNVVARGLDLLPLTVTVSEQGTFKTEFTTEQANMEGHATSSFTFNAKLKNSTVEPQLYALRSNAPRGWKVTFKANHKQASSVNVEPNTTEDIVVQVEPPAKIEAGTYKIPLRATTSSTSADLDLEVVITGSYEVQLTTPRGLLSTDITAGDEKRVELVVRNTGSAALKDIKLDFSAPVDWDVVFDPKVIDELQPGKTSQVFATIKADDKAIPGDYVTTLEAETPEATSKATFRVTVKTPMMWGWTGVIIILVALGSVYNLFRKYGRR